MTILFPLKHGFNDELLGLVRGCDLSLKIAKKITVNLKKN